MKKIFLIPIFPAVIFATTLKIATYNVDNLFDVTNNGTEYEDYKPNKHNWNRITFEKKLHHISQVICDLNADVIALEEVENSNALEKLQEQLESVGCKYPFAAITDKRGSSIQVALLSRVRLKKKRDIKVSNSPADRNILEVTLKTEPPLTIFANHWRSKRAPESARVKYAKILMKRIEQMPKGSEYIILGDFNSDYDECTNISNKRNDANNICGIDTILKTYYQGRMIKFRDTNLPTESIYHYNLWSEIEAYKRWSHDFYGKKSALDSIIIPPSLVDNRGWFYKRGSFGVFKKQYLFNKKRKNSLARWEYKHGKHTGHGYSDHLPIYATFTTSLQKELKHESYLDKFWKLFIPKVKDNKKKISKKEFTLQELVKVKFLQSPIILKDVCVIYKRGDIGVIKSSFDSPAITLYRSAEGLEEGRCYDLKIYKKKRYYRLEEITDLDIVREKRSPIDINKYIPRFNASLMEKEQSIGEIVRDIHGVYKNRYLDVNGHRYRLFVKQREKGLLKKGNRLYIKKAQIGYYKGGKELIVYSLEDIKKEN